MKKILIILFSIVYLNAFGQSQSVEFRWYQVPVQGNVVPTAEFHSYPRRMTSFYIYSESGVMYREGQFPVREVIINKSILPRRSPMVFKRDTVITQEIKLNWGFRTETYYEAWHSSEFHSASLIWGY